jgi:hypothetical protein
MDYALKQIASRLAKSLASIHEGDFSKARDEASCAVKALDGLLSRKGSAPSDYRAPNLPLGYRTPIGYLHAQAPRLLELMTDLTVLVDVDEPFLADLTLKKGYAVCTVEAPRVLQDRYKSCLAFPEVVLREHYNV